MNYSFSRFSKIISIFALISFLFFSCTKENKHSKSLPIVSTNQVSDLNSFSVKAGGNVTSDNGFYVLAKGVCWSLSSNPTLEDNFTEDGNDLGSFTSTVTGLEGGKTYYLRAYATNNKGTAYGNNISFNTPSSQGTVTDKEGNVYSTIVIGSQTWMAENLRSTKYSDGSSIPQDGYYFYNNDISNKNTHGVLYTWDIAMKGEAASNSVPSNRQGVCPQGWHIPSDEEWKILEQFIGMPQSELNNSGLRGTNQGGKLKSTNSQMWVSPNSDATNQFGFNAFASGFYFNGAFYSLGYNSIFWSTSINNSNTSWFRTLSNDNGKIIRGNNNKQNGFSVRCVKN